MSAKKINTRIQQKHDKAANWETAGNNGFIPLAGEIIVYDEGDGSAPKFKVGDGVLQADGRTVSGTNINALPFAAMDTEGSMLKSVYDTDNDGIVDNAEKLGGYTPDKFVKLNESNSGDLSVSGIDISLQGDGNTSSLMLGLDHASLHGDTGFSISTNDISISTDNSDVKIHAPNGALYFGETDENEEFIPSTIYANLDGTATNATYATNANNAAKLGGVAADEYAKQSELPPLSAGISENSLAMTGNTAGALGYYFASLSIAEDGLSAEVTISQDGPFDTSTGTLDPTTIGWEVGDRVSIVNYNMYDNIGTVAAISNSSVSLTLISSISNSYNDVVHNDQDKSIVNLDKPHLGIIDFGLNTVALGKDNKALLSYSFVQGWNNEGFGKYSTIFGRNNSSGFAGFVAGWNNHCTGEYSDVFGQNNTVNGNGASVHGKGHNVDGEAAAVFGINNVVSGRAASTFGIGLQANAPTQTVIGKYNKENADAYFIIGAGQGSATDKRKNILEVTPTQANINGTLVSKTIHATGSITNGTAVATGSNAVSFGKGSETYAATGECAFSAGINNINGYRAAATFGIRSQTARECQFVCGRDNAVNSNALFIVGNGTGSANKSNALTVEPSVIKTQIPLSFVVDCSYESYVGDPIFSESTIDFNRQGLAIDLNRSTHEDGTGVDNSALFSCSARQIDLDAFQAVNINAPVNIDGPLYGTSVVSANSLHATETLRIGNTVFTEAQLKKLVSFLDTIAD